MFIKLKQSAARIVHKIATSFFALLEVLGLPPVGSSGPEEDLQGERKR
jgi:hypothetical protein